jgi:hypothetical protein
MTGREALRPSEPCHSPNKATPSYYTKNGSFASGISKMWWVSSHFHRRGVFIGLWRNSTDLAEAVTRHVAAGQPSHVVGRALLTTTIDFEPRILLLNRCCNVAVKS